MREKEAQERNRPRGVEALTAVPGESIVGSGQGQRPAAHPHLGLALAGGAPEGAIYEIGALRALDEALVGASLTDFGVYVGISAGAFHTSCLANGLSTAQMCRAIVKPEPGEHPFTPETFFKPATQEVVRRLASAPWLLASALLRYATRRERRLRDALTVLGRSLPTGIFDSAPVGEYVRKIFALKGRKNDFRQLACELVVVATDLESGAIAPFGAKGWDHVPISKAIQASSALPGLYPPVEIEGRYFVDGVLRKTLHASVALDAGAKLVFAINPLVPVDLSRAAEQHPKIRGKLIRRGLPAVLSQTARTLIHSRMTLGLETYKERYPDCDVLLIEPRPDDDENFFSNIFSFASRRDVCQRAYQATRRDLWQRREEIQPILRRHGLDLDLEVLRQDRDLWRGVGLPQLSEVQEPRRKRSTPGLLGDLDDLLDRLEDKLVTTDSEAAA